MKNSTRWLIIVSLLLIVFPTSIVLAESHSHKQSEISMEILPARALFQIENMKPGDWAERSVVIRNNGKAAATYQMTLENNGTKKLFNELTLEIKDSQMELFNGKLANFASLALKDLAAGKEQELQMIVRFPEHLGNDFQGLETDFSLLFTATGKTDDVTIEGVDDNGNGDSFQSSGTTLPETATNLFKLLLIGGVLIALGGLVMIYQKVKSIESHR